MVENRPLVKYSSFIKRGHPGRTSVISKARVVKSNNYSMTLFPADDCFCKTSAKTEQL